MLGFSERLSCDSLVVRFIVDPRAMGSFVTLIPARPVYEKTAWLFAFPFTLICACELLIPPLRVAEIALPAPAAVPVGIPLPLTRVKRTIY